MSKCQGRKSLFDSLTIKTIAKISSAFTQIIVSASKFVVEEVLQFMKDKRILLRLLQVTYCLINIQLTKTKFFPNT